MDEDENEMMNLQRREFEKAIALGRARQHRKCVKETYQGEDHPAPGNYPK